MSTPAAPSHAPRLGVRFEPDWAPELLPDFARWAESAGFDELWFSEDLPWAGGIAMAATALAITSRLHVGLGLLPVATRNTATVAMELAALARLAPGRLTIALGHGIPSWMAQIGVRVERPLAALEQTALTLRRLLAGEEVTVHGELQRIESLRLGHPPEVAPEILIGTAGPKGLAVAGRSSDGVLLAEISTPEAVRWARDASAQAGRAGSTVVLAMLALDDDAERALAALRPRLQRIADFGVFARLTEFAGLGADGSGALTDDVIRSVAVTGTPAEAAATVRAWAQAGAATVVLVSGDERGPEGYRRFATEALPLLAPRE